MNHVPSWSEFIQLVTLVAAVWTARKVHTVAHEMNSIRDQLVDTTRDEAHARGLLQGREESRP